MSVLVETLHGLEALFSAHEISEEEFERQKQENTRQHLREELNRIRAMVRLENKSPQINIPFLAEKKGQLGQGLIDYACADGVGQVIIEELMRVINNREEAQAVRDFAANTVAEINLRLQNPSESQK